MQYNDDDNIDYGLDMMRGNILELEQIECVYIII